MRTSCAHCAHFEFPLLTGGEALLFFGGFLEAGDAIGGVAKVPLPSKPARDHSGCAHPSSHCEPDAGHLLPTFSAHLPPWLELSPNIQITAPSFCQTPPRASIQADVRPTHYLNKITKAYNRERYLSIAVPGHQQGMQRSLSFASSAAVSRTKIKHAAHHVPDPGRSVLDAARIGLSRDLRTGLQAARH